MRLVALLLAGFVAGCVAPRAVEYKCPTTARPQSVGMFIASMADCAEATNGR